MVYYGIRVVYLFSFGLNDSSLKIVYKIYLTFQVLEGLDAVLDVGGVYDPNHDRYDHHQKGFEEVFGHGFNTKLSSAGLVYKVFIYSIGQLKILLIVLSFCLLCIVA